jgi:hypothetical protein
LIGWSLLHAQISSGSYRGDAQFGTYCPQFG